MSTHNICFHGEIRKIPWRAPLIWSYVYNVNHIRRNIIKRTFGRVLSEDSDQLAHSCSLIRIFTGHSLDS